MGSLNLLQFFINICLGLGLGFLWIKIMRPQKDDPRMSRGLQLLQSKIAVLEDLSDRTDHQVKQLALLLDEKAKNVQRSIEAANEQMNQLSQSMIKSQEVAKIFQDKIPHEEIVDRQNTIKYVRAAQMAFAGSSLDEIEKAVDIPRSELEFIVKVNRERLMFSPSDLPDWVKSEVDLDAVESEKSSTPVDALERAYREAFEPAPEPSSSLNQIGEEFRRAVAEMTFEEEKPGPSVPAPVAAPVMAPVVAPAIAAPEVKPVMSNGLQKSSVISANANVTVTPYQFPKVSLNKE